MLTFYKVIINNQTLHIGMMKIASVLIATIQRVIMVMEIKLDTATIKEITPTPSVIHL